ncbi:ATP-binding cassette domain-containing protein [Bacteroidota bacterium]
MIELKNINKTFNKNAENEIKALNDITIAFNPKEWSYIIGGNGSGKSTLLKIINQELTPDKGELFFNEYTKNDLFFVDQTTLKNLVPAMSIYENLIFGLRNEGIFPNLNFYMQKKYKLKIIDILKDFNLGLENRLDEQVRFLSGGEQQIIVAARILLSKSKILLMDEFTSSLDQKWAPFILQKLKKNVIANNIMVIAITHDFSQIESIGDRVIMLKNGRIIEDVKQNTFNFTTKSILNLFYEKQ